MESPFFLMLKLTNAKNSNFISFLFGARSRRHTKFDEHSASFFGILSISLTVRVLVGQWHRNLQ